MARKEHVGWVVLGTVLGGVILSIALTNLCRRGDVLPAATAALQSRQQPPEPRLEETYGAELTKVRDAENDHLHNYAPVDMRMKLVRIPIERAMEILLQQEEPAPAAAGTQEQSEK